ncbi:bifunctional [glutamate--ammonia ligase]-adenylyl-L-tyrosine phosphorylase/[glutamate--ammonia-ligase] adenylyltransferase [Maricurvus nonylphenolicus]|uniref:bifunctional [glutamate--ammonia ligase]-adenylyl-L-tyrosine phosphorylase/[glutamate--ammonia-ligase] adenylyltransferase n=1 Tax=Maricurvus nonylphenolicus TaxID=1008307 RepID=UPI0036F388BD
MFNVEKAPAFLRDDLTHVWTRWHERAMDDQQQALAQWLDQDNTHPDQLLTAWGGSDFIAQSAMDRPDVFIQLLSSGELTQTFSLQTFSDLLAEMLANCENDKDLDRQLRLYRRRMMMRIVWRDFNRLADWNETTNDMSYLAEVVVQQTIDFHYQQLSQSWGTPMGKASGEQQQLLVLGMGKLGGFELNVSSDIDLIFAYPESGTTQGGRKEQSNQEFFNRLGQRVIKSIDAHTADGFVFRVDMRLRPYGQSGALVLNFDSLEEYYQTQGREWERYAMIKARVIAGPEEKAVELMNMLRPFTYRRYIDFSAIEALRDMKGLINREVARKGMSADVKLGAGGIREVEFIVQAFQLIRGGRDERLQTREVMTLLPLLESEGLMPEGVSQKLMAAYVFLRNTEHAIQGYQDKQTQALPVDEKDGERLAWVMGFDSWDAFIAQLDLHRNNVNQEFHAVVADSAESEGEEADDLSSWRPLWLDDLCQEDFAEQLSERGFEDADAVAKALCDLKKSRALLTMQAEGRARLDALMPKLLMLLSERDEQANTLSRILVLIEAVARRTAYLLLLVENPNALKQLVRLCGASPWIADQLARHPALLDELLDQRSLYNPPDLSALRDELRQEVLRVGWDDLEGQMETLRYFRMAHALRVAAAEVSGALPLMKVSDYLTWIAEVILEHVQALAWEQMVDRHGKPSHAEGEPEPEFIVVGYGKMGGIELGHGSDLDLVFIHNASSKGYTDGDKQLDNQTFYTRMGQKMIHILNTQTISGQLYEVDMRLRPSGNSGMLVSSLTAFEKYQRSEAWTWEHQALVRARVVAGGERLAKEFQQLRLDILCQQREKAKLVEDVVTMRQKMRDHLGTQGGEEEKASKFHLKQDAGGIVDIEFLVQYAVLSQAAEHPQVAHWTDNIRILGDLHSQGLMSAEQSDALIEAYKTFRSESHRLALQQQKNEVGADKFAEQRQQVQAIWAEWLG